MGIEQRAWHRSSVKGRRSYILLGSPRSREPIPERLPRY
jgi:hypothetical protein